MQVIKQGAIIEDAWQLVGLEDTLPEGDVIVPWARWKSERDSLLKRPGKRGVQINGDDDLDEVVADLAHFALIALEFPRYADGRCYSAARLLRDRYRYQGELRAVGDVLRDQLFYMQRCGIDSFQLRPGEDYQRALKAFQELSVKYQSAADRAQPIYRLR
ncbi:MAG: DUF934 domain-containing protein [Pseudomonadota bacterium]